MESNISLMYILKMFCIKIRDWECAHCGLYPRFLVLTGLFSVHISLNVIVKYTWNAVESSRIRIWKAYCTRFEIIKYVRILTVFETCAAMQSVFTCFPVMNIN